MRILESSPSRYDVGIRLLTLGGIDRSYDRLVSHISKGQRVLDIGCGTGLLTLGAAEKGARVTGIDTNSQMLEVAQQRAKHSGLTGQVDWKEMGVSELDTESSESFDVVMSGLCFSELTREETIYTLNQVKRILRPEGLLLIADETKPPDLKKRIMVEIFRFPLVVITYLLTQTTTRAIRELPQLVKKVDFNVLSIRFNRLHSFVELVGQKQEKT